jgi:hypothetical protein
MVNLESKQRRARALPNGVMELSMPKIRPNYAKRYHFIMAYFGERKSAS